MFYSGAIREKLKAKLRSKISISKAEERKLMEERRKLDEEELYNGETGELSDMEAQLDCEEDSCDSEEELRSSRKEDDVSEDRSEVEESGEEGEGIDKKEKGESDLEEEGLDDNEHEGSDSDRGSEDIDSEGSDDDDVYFVPGGIKRNRIIESDDDTSEHEQYHVTKEGLPNDNLSHDNEDKSCDSKDKSPDNEETSCDSKETSHDIKADTNNITQFASNTIDEASMEPLVYSGTLDREGESLIDEPVNEITSKLLIDESSQLTELVQEEEEGGRYMETSYQLGPSLPPHQLPRVIREESDELFMTTPSITRQSSTVSDKVRRWS